MTPVTRSALFPHVAGCIACYLLLLLGSPLAAQAQLPVVAENQAYEGSFILENPHDVAIRISDVQASCTCDELTLPTHFLLPHERITVQFRVDNTNASGERRHKVWFLLSDPNLDSLEHVLHWQVRPLVAVDAMPPAGPFNQRPSKQFQDVYQYFVSLKPDELDRINRAGRKIIRIWSPPSHTPEGGLQLTLPANPSQLWGFTLKQQAPHDWLLIANRHPDQPPVAIGVYREPLHITTNIPDKPSIELIFHSQVDPMVGTGQESDPWSDLRW